MIRPGRPGAARATRTARALPPVIVALVVALDVAGGWRMRDADNALLLAALVLAETVTAAGVGLLVVRRHPRHAVGWLLLAHGLLVAAVLSAVLSSEALASWVSPGAAAWAVQLGQGSWVFLYVCLAMIGYLFPDGRFLSRGWHRFTIACLACYGPFLVAETFDVGSIRSDYPGVDPPLPGLPPAITDLLDAVGSLGIIASLVGAVVCARSRLRRSAGEERTRILWLAWAALSIPAGWAVCLLDIWINAEVGTLTVLGVTTSGSVLPLAIGIGILRHRLFDIELALSRTLTYAALTAVVIATYGAVLQGLGAVVGDRGIAGLVAVGVVAVAIQPLHARVRAGAQRLVYGDRPDPYAALRRLADRLDQTPDPAQVIQSVTGSVAEALRVSHVAVELDSGSGPARAAHGVRGRGPMAHVPLTCRGERLGDLAVEVPPGRQLTAADRRMLDDLARHAGVAVNAVRLTLDLQASRLRIVAAFDEARRAIERDLHDGAQQQLVALAVQLGLASQIAEDDPAAVPGLLAALRKQAQATIGELRELAHGIYPPLLRERGLAEALQAAAGRCPLPCSVRVDLPGRYPEAVETAAYFCCLEALHNAGKHAGAQATVAVRAGHDGPCLWFAVADDGAGFDPGTAAAAGHGFLNMRDRLGALGGTVEINSRPGAGTTVRGVIPAEPLVPR